MPLTAESAVRKDRTTANGGPELQHRHFAFIAATLASLKPAKVADDHVHSFWENTVRVFADSCAQSNSRFNRARFYVACNYP